MATRTAEDVASMETELHDLRALLNDLKQRLVASDTERKSLKIENVILQRKADDNLAKATKIEAIMSMVSAGLVSGLKEMHEEREVARAVRRQVQEHQLGVGDGDQPALARPVTFEERQTRVEDTLTPEEQLRRPTRPSLSDMARSDQLRGAAEHVGPPPAFLRPRVDPAHADRYRHVLGDANLNAVTDDEQNLRDLARNMG